MVYVNKIGALVHDIVVNYYGIANKNVGDAFLLSCRLQDGEIRGFLHIAMRRMALVGNF